MRLNNLKSEDKRRVYSGDIKHLKYLLVSERGKILEDLSSLPLDTVEENRGKAKVLANIIKLLP